MDVVATTDQLHHHHHHPFIIKLVRSDQEAKELTLHSYDSPKLTSEEGQQNMYPESPLLAAQLQCQRALIAAPCSPAPHILGLNYHTTNAPSTFNRVEIAFRYARMATDHVNSEDIIPLTEVYLR